MNSDTIKGVRDGEFNDNILRQAIEISQRYHILIREGKNDGFIATCAEIPLSIKSASAEKALRDAREAATVAVASILEDGDMPPQPVDFHRRTEQVNVRLSAEDKRVIQEASRAKGFNSLSEYFRQSALAAASTDLKRM